MGIAASVNFTAQNDFLAALSDDSQTCTPTPLRATIWTRRFNAIDSRNGRLMESLSRGKEIDCVR